MNTYKKWTEEKYPKKCPVHNCYIFHPSNSQNYIPNQSLYTYKQNPQITKTKNLDKNHTISQYNHFTQYDQRDPTILLKQYKSPDGVLRGYNNNYSFYISGTSKGNPKVTINNQINNYTTQTMGQYPYQNRQINTGGNPSYIILEKEPIIYNYNTGDFGGFKYNEVQNKNISSQQRVYQAPKIERRKVKREANHKNINYISGPRDNYRNINTNEPQPMFQRININNNYRKYSGNQINNIAIASNKRSISPMNQPNYSRPIISQKQRQVQNNLNNNYSYQQKPHQYRIYTEQNDYQFYGNNYPQNNYNNYYQKNNQQREYTSRTELPDQRGFNYEYEQEDYEDEEDNENEDDIYEVPVQPAKYNNNKREIYSERPFTRINNYSQIKRNGKRYGVYTQTLAMNNNYYENEYEPNNNNITYNNYKNYNYNNNYSQPKYRPGGYTGQEREFTIFEKSLRNIRLNNEEIEMENDQRNNNRVKIKTSGANNHRLYISNSNQKYPKKNYRTFTEQNAYRNQNYVLQDLEEDDYDYINKNKYNNLHVVKMNRNNNKYYNNEEEIENDDEDSDNENGDEKMYDNNKLKTAKEDNFNIMRQKENKNEEEINNKNQIEEDQGIYNEDGMPHDGDEIPKKKRLKNIETEINEKYYDNKGNYLGEKKIITTKQVPVDDNDINNEKDEENEEEQEQEEIEEYENENLNYNENNNEYLPYKLNNKHYKKRVKNTKYQKKEEQPSKYHSYFGDCTNNVYYESKADSKSINKNEGKYNINNKQNIQIKNDNLGIQSENLCVPAEENYDNNEEKESDNNEDDNDNDEKEADEQQIEENEILDDEKNNNNINNNIENQNDIHNEENIKDNQNEINYEEKNNNELKNNNEKNNDTNDKNEEQKENEDIKGEELNDTENIHEEEIQKQEIQENNLDNNEKINNIENENLEKENIEENNEQINDNENLNQNNQDNNINDENKQNLEENEMEDIENNNIQNEEGEEEYAGEEYEEMGEEMVEMEYEMDENNNEQQYGEEENIGEEEENENYEMENENIQ